MRKVLGSIYATHGANKRCFRYSRSGEVRYALCDLHLRRCLPSLVSEGALHDDTCFAVVGAATRAHMHGEHKFLIYKPPEAFIEALRKDKLYDDNGAFIQPY